MLLQATVMATVRAAADNALKSARAVCLDGGRVKPNIGRSAWPAPSALFQFDFHLDEGLQAIDSAINDATIAASEHMQHFDDDDGCTTAAQDAEFHPLHPHRDTSADDQAGPATTLHARLSSRIPLKAMNELEAFNPTRAAVEHLNGNRVSVSKAKCLAATNKDMAIESI